TYWAAFRSTSDKRLARPSRSATYTTGCPANLRPPSSFRRPHRSRPDLELGEPCAAPALDGLRFRASQPLLYPGRSNMRPTCPHVSLETLRLDRAPCRLGRLHFSGSFLGVVRQLVQSDRSRACRGCWA